MKNVVSQIVATLLSLLNQDTFKKVVDGFLDKVEESVAGSESKVDDAVILPLCKKARELLNVPDND
ncbi:MAG: hypothetical protein [Siphoviridae sp. ctCJE6]|nr:MAG: hypothetical protein [Siphoviridae sp. ctCJE6]